VRDDTSRNGVTEYYELRHTHIPQGDERIEIGGGRTMQVPNFDLASPNALYRSYESDGALASTAQSQRFDVQAGREANPCRHLAAK
jgi:hypothetical protein